MLRLLLLLALLLPGSTWAQTTTILNLGEQQILSQRPSISGDGQVVAWRGPGCTGSRWTQAEGVTTLDPACTVPQAISQDGAVIVGSSSTGWPNAEAFRWETGVLTGLGDLRVPGHHSTAFGVSADGSRVVGFGTSQVSTSLKLPFLWTLATGLVQVPGFTSSLPIAISPDGNVVAGVVGTQAAITSCGTPSTCTALTSLGDVPGGSNFSEPAALTVTPADEIIVVGRSNDAIGDVAFRWAAAEGMIALDRIDAGSSLARDVTPDGTLIVGESGGIAAVWDAANGARDLQAVLETEHGLDLSAWTLRSVTGVSDDGLRLVGYAFGPGGGNRVWLVTLGTPLVISTPVPTLPGLAIVALGGVLFAAAVSRLRRIRPRT